MSPLTCASWFIPSQPYLPLRYHQGPHHPVPRHLHHPRLRSRPLLLRLHPHRPHPLLL